MRACLLALLMMALLPGVVFAHPPAPSDPYCGASHVSLLDGAHCVSGTVLYMGDSFLAVRPQHNKLKVVLLTADTVYHTSSGAAALEGLVQGDFVCVAGHDQDDILAADVVTFDVRPFSCGR